MRFKYAPHGDNTEALQKIFQVASDVVNVEDHKLKYQVIAATVETQIAQEQRIVELEKTLLSLPIFRGPGDASKGP